MFVRDSGASNNLLSSHASQRDVYEPNGPLQGRKKSPLSPLGGSDGSFCGAAAGVARQHHRPHHKPERRPGNVADRENRSRSERWAQGVGARAPEPGHLLLTPHTGAALRTSMPRESQVLSLVPAGEACPPLYPEHRGLPQWHPLVCIHRLGEINTM